MEVPTTADTFMKEVRDNFLICKLCDKDFNRPKTLPCMHTFCQDCLVQYADEQSPGESRQTYRYSTYCKPLSCPVCRRRTDITKDDVATLPDNFLISSLSGIIRDKSEETISCQICSRRPKGRRPPAVKRCLECNKQLCKRCVTQHQDTKVTQSHTLYSLENAHRLMCAEHDDEGVRFICKTCSKCVCVFCTHTSHKGHDLMSILEGTETCQREMEQTMDICNERMHSISDQLKFIQMWEQCYSQTKEHIVSTATDFLSQVESQRQLVLAKLDSLYGPEVLEMLNKKDLLMESLEGLSGACKYKDLVPDNFTIEAILIQTELQNKVKRLLDTPLPVSLDQLPSTDVTISFEKGGLSLGSLITKDGEEEPLYYDADEIDGGDASQAPSWCRKCRSRSRSRSRGTDMLERQQRGTRSLTPFISDTDISLTDVSALGTMSPLFSGAHFGSQASDVDRIPSDTAEFGTQAELHLSYIEAATQYIIPEEQRNTQDILESVTRDIPDVVPCSKQTTDAFSQYEPQPAEDIHHSIAVEDRACQSQSHPMVDSSSQHIAQVINSACQHDLIVFTDSSSQYDVLSAQDASCQQDISTTHSMTQYDLASTQDSMTQYELVSTQDSIAQYDTIITKNSVTQCDLIRTRNSLTQYDAPGVRHSMTQYDLANTKESMTQYDLANTKESMTQYDLANTKESMTQYDSASTKNSMTQYDSAVSRAIGTTTDIQFGHPDVATCIGRDVSTDTALRLVPVVQLTDQISMTNPLPTSIDQSTTMTPTLLTQRATMTEPTRLVDTATEPITGLAVSQESQTDATKLCDVHTNTAASPSCRDAYSNTDSVSQSHQTSQTTGSKTKTRGVTARPSMADCGVEVRPLSAHAVTNTPAVSVSHLFCQTVTCTKTDRATNTLPPSSTSKGITAHIPGVPCQTSTADLTLTQGSSTQTEVSMTSVGVSVDSRESSVETSTNTSVDSEEVACGADTPMSCSRSVAVSTQPLPTRYNVGVNVAPLMSDSWTNPVIQPVCSKACGTERVKHRNVGLHVRPMSTDNSSMTQPPSTSTIACGDDSARLQISKQSDTAGLVVVVDSNVNTDPPASKSTSSRFSQTRHISTADSYTVTLHGLPVDRSTNTPHQLPQEVLDQFQLSPSPSTDVHSRTTQTDWIQRGLPCTACLSLTGPEEPSMRGSLATVAPLEGSLVTQLQSGTAALHGYGTAASHSHGMAGLHSHPMAASHNHGMSPPHNPDTAPPDSHGTTVPHSHDTAAPHSHGNVSDARPHLFTTTSTAVAPPLTCDRSTSTATLSSLLHPDSYSSDCMDTKISECIVKLRQVTKKLQKSSTDVTKVENSTCSSNNIDQNDGQSASSSYQDVVGPRTVSGSNRRPADADTLRRLVRSWRRHSTQSDGSPSGLAQDPPHMASRMLASDPQHELTRDKEERRVPVSPLAPSEGELARGATRRLPHRAAQGLDHNSSSTPGSEAALSYHSATLRAASIVSSPRLVKKISMNRPSDFEYLPHTLLSSKHQRDAADSSSGRLSHDSNRGSRSAASHQPAQANMPSAQATGHQWDLKSLVHEEDRIKKAMRKSTENLHYLHRRDSSSTSIDSSIVSLPMYSAESSLYGSTESLGHPAVRAEAAARGRDAARIASTCAVVDPASFPSPSTAADTPAHLSEGITAGSDSLPRPAQPARTKAKMKARSKQLRPSALLGNDATNENESTKGSLKDVPLMNRRDITHTTSAKGFMTSVVRKVQSIARPMRPADRATELQSSTSSEASVNNKQTKKLSADRKLAKSSKKSATENTCHSSDACGERLAYHSAADRSFPSASGKTTHDGASSKPKRAGISSASGKAGSQSALHSNTARKSRQTVKKAWL